jgi:hypothetical protein
VSMQKARVSEAGNYTMRQRRIALLLVAVLFSFHTVGQAFHYLSHSAGQPTAKISAAHHFTAEVATDAEAVPAATAQGDRCDYHGIPPTGNASHHCPLCLLTSLRTPAVVAPSLHLSPPIVWERAIMAVAPRHTDQSAHCPDRAGPPRAPPLSFI